MQTLCIQTTSPVLHCSLSSANMKLPGSLPWPARIQSTKASRTH